MADHNQQPQFLGGGPKFNRAGAQPPDAEVSVTPEAPPPNRARTWMIVAAVLVLIGLLFAIENGQGGLSHVQGRGGISPTQHTPGPDSDSGQ